MPSVVKPRPDASARAGAARKPSIASDGLRKRSQVLVSSESSHSVKSIERASSSLTSAAASKSSSASKLAEKRLRQKVDLISGAVVAASTATSRVVSSSNPTVASTRVKPQSSVPASGNTENHIAAKTTRASGATVVHLSNAKATVQRKLVAEPSRRGDSTASAVKRKSVSAAASSSSTNSIKHETSVSKSGRVAAPTLAKTNGTATSLVTKKPQLKQANGTSLTTGRTLPKHINASSAVAEQCKDTRGIAGDDKSSPSLHASKLEKLSLSSAVEDCVAGSDQVMVSNSVSVLSPVSMPPDETSSSLSDDVVVREPCKELAETSHRFSHSYSEFSSCESLRNNCCEHISESTDLIVSISHVDENDSDAEETSICDISLDSCRSDCSTSIFQSACSSIIGSVTPSLNSLMENDNLGMWSASHSVSMESLQSSAGYCTPSEQDNVCDPADCTISNADDSRYVQLLVLTSLYYVVSG